MQQRPRVYLAGPEVFLPNAAEIGRRKKALCAAHGFDGLFPFDNEATGAAEGRLDRLIYAANTRMMHLADLAVLNLTPFRGPSADVGTVFELGVMAALGKPVFGYTNVASDVRARVAGARQGSDAVWRDANGMTIEDFGNADNLMIDSCLADPNNGLVRFNADGRIDDLRGFELCLKLAAQRLAPSPGRQTQAG